MNKENRILIAKEATSSCCANTFGRYLLPGSRYLLPGGRYLLPGGCYLLPGGRYFMPEKNILD